MVVFVLGSIVLMLCGWFGLRVSTKSDFHSERPLRVTWYDIVLTMFMLGGAVLSVSGLIVLAWRFLP